MTKETGQKLLHPFIDQCDKDADPYFVVHFSRQDDWFNGLHDRMDKADALIIVNKLIELFNINPLLLTKPKLFPIDHSNRGGTGHGDISHSDADPGL